MASTLVDLLHPNELRMFAGSSTFQRGLEYYRLGRVSIESADEIEVRCLVRGTQTYWVDLWLHQEGELGSMCTCPYAEGGWFCKHMVAAGLAAHAYLLEHKTSTWRMRLDRVLAEQSGSASPKKPQPYWLFLSLKSDAPGWELIPHTLHPDKVLNALFEKAPEATFENLPELIEHNAWMLKQIHSPRQGLRATACINCNPEAVAFANLLLQQQRVGQVYYYNYNHSYPLADYLAFLARLDIPLFRGNYHNPVTRLLRIEPEPVGVHLHIQRTPTDVQLTAQLAAGQERLALREGSMELLTHQPPLWALVGDAVFEISSPVSAETLLSWIQSPRVQVPREDEAEFLERYFPTLARQFPVEGDSITWQEVQADPVPRLYLADENGELLVHLRFGYDRAEVVYDSRLPALSLQHQSTDAWTMMRVHRQPAREEQFYQSLASAHFGLKHSPAVYPSQIFRLRAKVHPIDFLMRHVPRLIEAGFEIYGEEKLKTARVNRSQPTLSLNVTSGIDWFDLQAVVKFGEVEAAINEVRRALRKKERYVKLADGTIGEIPDEWVQRYRHLFGLAEQTGDGMRLSNHHLTLVDQLLAEADRVQADEEFRQRRSRLLDFKGIQNRELPAGFAGELRPYQKAGFDWLHFLHDYDFGGCLADDMGLGKTIETLVFLQSLKERNHSQAASLLVVPRSLLVNWQREAARFTPALRLHEYFGQGRSNDLFDFKDFDLVLTTYGVMLRDVEWLRKYKFHYVILDESQAIKNPLAKTAKAARLLHCDHRLALTGTPVENTTFELWSQFAFLNPGLLGNLEYFKSEFGSPIEKQGDEQSSDFLRKLVYPFILRRTKAQVAPELPPRTERVVYADMEPAQRKFYEKTREYYRALLLGAIESEGMNNVRFKVLEGLLRLRQICNHPRLVKDDFRGDSAKFELLVETLETLQAEGHKALVFSQFVQMLTILREALDVRKLPYVYLDGRTQKRQERVDTFQNDASIPFFLISLKAGGVGLNLTAADYVIHIDPWWNPAVEMQATDRTHRIGQEKPVFVYKLITRDSVEEKILRLQEKKKVLVEQLITTESSFFKSLTAEDVKVLFS